MKGKLTTFPPGKTQPTVKDIETAPDLPTLQKEVGGYIEQVPGFRRYRGEPCVAFCNEDGKSQNLPYNKQATLLWHISLPPPGLVKEEGILSDVLVGPVVIITGDDELMEDL